MNKKEFAVAKGKFDIFNFIKSAKENLGWVDIDTDFIVFLYSHNNMCFENDLEEKIDLNELEKYFREDDTNAIFIPIAISDMDGGIILANKKVLEESKINMGSIELYEDTVVGLVVSLVNEEYKILITEFNACTGSYEITEDHGDFGNEVIELIDRFTIKEIENI